MNDSRQPAGLLRRLAACFYDTLLLMAVLMLAGSLWLPVTGDDGVPEPFKPLFQLYLLAVVIVFFSGFWLRGGQTLGMKAWHMYVENPEGGRISFRQSLIRLAVAAVSWGALGLGFLWSLVDRERRTWHDIASNSVIVVRRPQRKSG